MFVTHQGRGGLEVLKGSGSLSGNGSVSDAGMAWSSSESESTSSGARLRPEWDEAVRTGERPQDTLTDVMSRRDFLRLGGAGLVGAALSTTLPGIADPGSIAAAGAATRKVALGAFAPSLPWSFGDIDEFSSLVGRKPAIIHWFQDWVMDFDPAYLDAAVARNGMPLISWEPWKFGGGLDQPRYALKKIIDGKHDPYIRRWARAAAAWGKPFFLRFAHEMNSDWTSWSPGVNGNTSRQYRRAWRRVYKIFQNQGATNVKWVWAPVAYYQGSTPYKYVYPGHAYVHWLGVSGYNWGNTRSWSSWQSFSKIFGKSYNILKGMARKPIMVAEMGCTEKGGNKATWIRQAYLRSIPDNFPRIKAVVWFHANKENDWRVNSSPRSLNAYKDVVASPRYQRRLL